MTTSNRDAFDRQAETVLYRHHPSLRRMTKQEVKDVTVQDIEVFYQHYLAGSQDYQLYLVGDLDSDELQAQLTRYIANIPVNVPHFKESHTYPKLEKSERVTGHGIGGEASFITLMYECDKTDLPWFDTTMNKVETSELSHQLSEAIRETLGLTYSVQASFTGSSVLNNSVRLQIDLSVAPNQVENAIAAINDELHKRANTPIEASDIDRNVHKQRRSYNKKIAGMKRMMIMATASIFNRTEDTVLDADISVPSYTGDHVNELYRKLIGDKARHVEFVLNP